MRKKMLLLGFALTALAASFSPRVEASSGNHACPSCVTYSDGSQCCTFCECNAKGVPIFCLDSVCPEEP